MTAGCGTRGAIVLQNEIYRASNWKRKQQERNPGVQPILDDALRQFDSLRRRSAYQRLRERLAADQALVWRLQWAGYDGPDWQELAAALVGYGVQVIRAWIISGRIFSECRLKGLGGELMKNQELPVVG